MATDRPATLAISPLAGRDRRLGGEHEHRGVHGLEVSLGLGRVMPVDRAGPGSVDQLHAAGQQRRVHDRGDRGQVLAVARVAALGHQLAERAEREDFGPAAREDRRDTLVRAVPDGRRQRGQRCHPGGQHRAAEQGVHQRALAPLGLSGDQHPQPLPGEPAPQPIDKVPLLVAAQPQKLPERGQQRVGLSGNEHAASYLCQAGTIGGRPRLEAGPTAICFPQRTQPASPPPAAFSRAAMPVF